MSENPKGPIIDGGGMAQVVEGANSTQIVDSLGVIMIGVIAIFLLRALLVSHKQLRRMMENQIKYYQDLVKE